MTLTRRGLLTAGTVASLSIACKPLPGMAAELGTLVAVAPAAAVPDAPFETQDGKPHRLSEYAGKPLLVNLWATWCPPCIAELPSLVAFARRMGPSGIMVLPISLDRGGAPTVTAFYSSHGISGLPVLIDPDGALMHAFGARGLPTTYVVDRAGKVVAMTEGGVDWTAPAVLTQLQRFTGAESGAHA